MIPLVTPAPEFSLLGIDGKTHALKDYSGKKAYVVMFICNHCPYVVAVQDRIAALAKEFTPKGVQFFGINSNDYKRYPDDAPEHMREQAKRVGFDFPYLVDEAQTVARAYDAVCTPDLYVFDAEKKLVYRGRIDDSWKEPTKVKRRDLHEALSNLLNSKAIDSDQHPSMGCSIKWRA